MKRRRTTESEAREENAGEWLAIPEVKTRKLGKSGKPMEVAVAVVVRGGDGDFDRE